ncbi:pilus assembly PilX family protein [Idiomarina aquatica]|nr:pilus assembly PilX N-terminal domain-containing protein [Idiomarina aquatica]
MHQQRGAVLAMAIFIIVVLSFVGVAVVNILTSSSKATVSEVYGARALFAARSGAEIFLADELLANADSFIVDDCGARNEGSAPSDVDVNPYQVEFSDSNGSGLSDCRAEVYCDQVTTPLNSLHVRVESIGSCAISDNEYSRVLLLEASDAVL